MMREAAASCYAQLELRQRSSVTSLLALRRSLHTGLEEQIGLCLVSKVESAGPHPAQINCPQMPCAALQQGQHEVATPHDLVQHTVNIMCGEQSESVQRSVCHTTTAVVPGTEAHGGATGVGSTIAC